MARRRNPWRLRAAAVLLLACLAGGAWLWWQGRHWAPARASFPKQGALVGAADGDVDFAALRAVGASFVYLEASRGAEGRDPAFARNMAAAQDGGLQVGAVHAFDPCVPAERQAANFVTIVPRGTGLLPPAVALERTAEHCPDPTSEAAVESELTTFLNQIEGHVGEPALLMLSPAFEERYRIANRLDRALWLARDWFQPDYAGRPWTLWTANSSLMTQAHDAPLRWLAVQP